MYYIMCAVVYSTVDDIERQTLSLGHDILVTK